MLKRSLSLLLALLMLFPLLTACADKAKKVDIVKKGESEYVIICPAGNDEESKTENKAAMTLYEAIREKTGVVMTYATDEDEPYEKEILVGLTSREISSEYREELRRKDYLIAATKDQVIILGGSAEATAAAVEAFIEGHINGTEQTVSVYQNKKEKTEHDYALGMLSVNGIPLSTYRIVYPESAKESTGTDLISYYTALVLADYLEEYAGLCLPVTDDSGTPADREILIGKTSRAPSKAVGDKPIGEGKYLVRRQGEHLVLQGDSYMVAGAAGALMNIHFASRGVNLPVDADISENAEPETFVFPKATSAIIMIGDGMGDTHIDATIDSGKLDAFVARELPSVSFCTTASASVIAGKVSYTDSAAAATALATGYKTLNGYLGLDENKKEVQNVRELAHSTGAKTGVLTTDAITGATPGGFLCHHNKRNDTAKLQSQISKLQSDGKIDYCKGSVSQLADPARDALRKLSANGSSFFMMIEEAHIDKRSHEGNKSLGRMQDCVVRYNECIAYVIAFVMMHPYTALIITADHETGGLEKQPDGSYVFNNMTSADYWQHTNAKAPIFALGNGVATLVNPNHITDNTDVAKFVANIFGNANFGQ